MIFVKDRDGDHVEFNGSARWETTDDLLKDMLIEISSDGFGFNYPPYKVISEVDGYEVTLTEVNAKDFVSMFKD